MFIIYKFKVDRDGLRTNLKYFINFLILDISNIFEVFENYSNSVNIKFDFVDPCSRSEKY